MEHSIIFKQKDTYASFPLLQLVDNRLLVGFFTAPIVDHAGVFEWKTMESSDNGKTWGYPFRSTPYDWPAVSAREKSDRFATTLPSGEKMVTGSFGFGATMNLWNDSRKIEKSKRLFLRTSSDDWKTIEERAWEVPNVDVILTFPRHLQVDNLILIPAYALLKRIEFSRCLVWRSINFGDTWQLLNISPVEIDGNEMAFISTSKGILAHIRSDTNPFIMESWSDDDGRTWTYPVNIHNRKGNIAGGPSHLLRLRDNRILCTYGYRQIGKKMGIRAVVSKDEGSIWSNNIVLRNDGGFLSSLYKKRFWQKKAHPGNDVGYPVSVQLDNNEILTAYYITCSDNITHIASTKWRI